MDIELKSVRKIRENPDILEIEYYETYMSFLSMEYKRKSNVTNQALISKEHRWWCFVKNGNICNGIGNQLDNINPHLKLGETFNII